LSLILMLLRPSLASSTSISGLAAVSSLATAMAGFCLTLWTNMPTPIEMTTPTSRKNPNTPTMIQTTGLVFFGPVCIGGPIGGGPIGGGAPYACCGGAYPDGGPAEAAAAA